MTYPCKITHASTQSQLGSVPAESKDKAFAGTKRLAAWIYTAFGSVVFYALMKLSPKHKQLAKLEAHNLRDFYHSEFAPRKKTLAMWRAKAMTYFYGLLRLKSLSRHARQDYYAMMRQGHFACDALINTQPNQGQKPVIIIPGLNTPAVFFREMAGYFQQQGFAVEVAPLLQNGFAPIADSAHMLAQHIANMSQRYPGQQVILIGHCMGGIIAHYALQHASNHAIMPLIRQVITLGTGFMGAKGVSHLKTFWLERHPAQPVPIIFDQLISGLGNTVQPTGKIMYHNILTVWDFMVHFQDGLLDTANAMVKNHVWHDPAIDHLTLVLNHKVFRQIEALINSTVLPMAERPAG